jgi:tripartite-type tricarboxylate transporter receptor subunit TctC
MKWHLNSILSRLWGKPAVALLAMATPLLAFATAAQAQYPERPITLIVAWPPGSLGDLIPRLMAEPLGDKLGVRVTVVNKPGGGAIPGTLEALKAAPDGYTIFMESPATSSIQMAWMDDLPYKVEERTFIARAAIAPNAVVVNANSPWKSINDVMEAVKSDPASFRWAIAGGTGSGDVVRAQLEKAFVDKGVDLSQTKSVAFSGASQIMNALAGEHVDIATSSLGSALPLVDAGKARILALTAANSYYPQFPTTEHEGFPTVNHSFWMGYAGPPGMDPAVVKTLSDAMKAVLDEPAVQEKIFKLAAVPAFLPEPDFSKFILTEAPEIKALRPK